MVFDDFPFSQLTYAEKIHILDLKRKRNFDVKFGRAAIYQYLPRIFTSNAKTIGQFLGFREDELPAENRLLDLCSADSMQEDTTEEINKS